MAFMLLGYYDVRKDFKYVYWKDSKGKQEKPRIEGYPEDRWKERLRWAGTLIISLQLKNFLIGERRHDSRQLRPPPPRGGYSKFARTLVFRTILLYLLLDFTSWLITSSPFLCFRSIVNPSLTPLRGVFEHIAARICMMAHLGAALALYTGYLPLSLLTVALWPFPHARYHPFISPYMATPHFGPISSIWNPAKRNGKVWGLRAFWGTFWHGNMRYYTSTPGLALANILGLQPKSTVRYMIVVSMAFALSGAVHAGMVPPRPWPLLYSQLLGGGSTAAQLRCKIAGFFILQIPGIAFEAIIDSSFSPRQPSINGETTLRKGRAHGHAVNKQKAKEETRRTWSPAKQLGAALWFTAWFSGTMWMTVMPVGRELGWWKCPAVPVSIVSWVMGKPQWWAAVDWPSLLEALRSQ